VLTLTLLRVGVGLILAAHGIQKLADPSGTASAFANMGIPFPELSVWLAIAGELLGGLGLLVGLLTPIAALGPVCTMLVAIVFVHAGNGLFAKDGGWEYPLTLLLASLYFAVRGAGPVSVDAMIRKARRREPHAGAMA
jgi:putative oxidoreductase